MGASSSAQRDAKSAEEASAVVEERVADLSETRGVGCRDDDDMEDAKLQKNGQISISSLNGKTDEQMELNGGDEEDVLAEVGQTETMPQKEGSPESIEVLQDEVSPQTNGEQEETFVTADETVPTEEKVAEEKSTESNEVGFKKIFRFVGFKFTLKKDKNEKIEPVQLLTVKETEDGASESALEETKEEPVTAEMQPEDEKKPDASETEKEASAEDAAKAEAETDLPVTDDPAETKADDVAEETEKTQTDKPAEDVENSTEKEKEPEPQAESPTSPPSQETQSPFRKFFSNLRKKTSFKKSKEEEPVKEKSAEEDIKEAEEKAEVAAEVEGQVKEVEKKVETEEQVEKENEASPEETPSTPENQKEGELKVEVETTSEAAPVQEPEAVTQTAPCEVSEASAAEEKIETKPTDDLKPTDDKTADSSEEQLTPAETTTEAEVQSSQDKAKAQGSPLKKLFTGAGLKKLSSKKQKGKKETELKQTESTEQAGEQIQSPTESGEAQKPDSSASSPEESGEHVVDETSQAEASVEAEGEATNSDSEKKKDGILHWASFKKLVTPKKRVKRPSESEDETPGDKPKSATLSSTESAVFEEKTEEIKASDEVKEEAKEESQVECKTETKAEKTEQSTEEPKRKIDTSVSWEALICVGSAKKRARKTSDSDDEETKRKLPLEEEVQQSGEEQAKTVESPLESSHEAEHENVASSPEPEGELVSTWESFKRLVTQRKKPKAEDKTDEAQGPEQALSDSELPKEESSFSLRKLIPRRKKKSDMKQGQASSDVGSAEEDSDTPAVVPLSEYDNEQSETATDEEKKTEQVKPEATPVTPVTPGKASSEDRSPSWISATVENVDDEADGKPLSDIPEEGDTAATPKSTDNTIAEDIVEFTSEAVTAIEPAEETEMVSALSRITESPDTSGETSPVPDEGVVKKTEAILQEAVETISVTSSAVTVTVAKEQTKSMAVSTIPFQMESAIKEEKVVLAVHEKSEAISICTGLNTSEIKAVEEETPLIATVEAVSTVSEVLSVEVATEDQTLKPEEAEVAEEKVFVAQVDEVQTKCKEQPPASVEHTMENNVAFQATSESQEEKAVKVEVTPIQQEMVVEEDTSKVVAETTVEPPVCAQTVITEITAAVDEVQELKDVTESVASAEVQSAEVAMAGAEEVTTSLPDTIVAETTVSQENSIPVHVATQEIVVTEEIVCVCPASEVHVTTDIEVVSNVSTVTELAGRTDEEEVETMHLKETEAIQEQSTVIVQEVIQNVVENLSEMHMEQELKEKPVEEEVPSAAEEEKLSQEAPVLEEESTVNTQVQEETKPETEDKAEKEARQIITESLPISEAGQISEKDQDAVAEEMKPQEDEEASSASVEATQLCTNEVESKTGEKEVEENKMVTTEREDGKWQVEKDQNKVAGEATETPTVEESSPTQSASLESTKHAEITAEASQQTQDMKMETTMEITAGDIHGADKDERAMQDAEITVQEKSTKSQEPSKDEPQTDLEEAQKDISAPDMKGQEGSEEPDCQKTDAEASEVKMAAEETPKASKEKAMEKEINTVTTES